MMLQPDKNHTDCGKCQLTGVCLRHPNINKSGVRDICEGGQGTEARERYMRLWDRREGLIDPSVMLRPSVRGRRGKRGGRTNPVHRRSCCNSPVIQTAVAVQAASVDNKPRRLSDIGDRLKVIIERETGAIPCDECETEIIRLNGLTVEQVRSQRADVARVIVHNATTKAGLWWQRWMVKAAVALTPAAVDSIVLLWVDRACEEGSNMGLRWAYGVTAVRQRLDDGLLRRTLDSLRMSGFDRPRLFVDGDATGFDSLGLDMTVRTPTVRTFGNWVLGLWELYVREPNAERYAMFQDDFVTVRNLRQYLEASPYPANGYLNLYTFPCNQQLAKGEGWYQSDQMGKGAVALVFDNEGVRDLLSQRHMVDRPLHVGRGHRSIDGGIVEAMKGAGRKEYVHNPSLVQHTGDISSMQNGRHALAPSFRGEAWDAMEMMNVR